VDCWGLERPVLFVPHKYDYLLAKENASLREIWEQENIHVLFLLL
jgi:hypothetical protein